MTLNTPRSTLLTPGQLLKTIIGVNIFMYIVSLIYSGKGITLSLNPLHMLTPSFDKLIYLGATGRLPILKFDSWWSLITANWLHGGLLHILFNMMALKTVAPLVMKEFGLSRMFIIYTLSGVVGFMFSFLGNTTVTIGASAGLCGLIGALWHFGRSRGGHWGDALYKQTSVWLITLGLFGFALPNIDNWGHAGGFIGGIILGWLLKYKEKRIENAFDRSIAVLFAVITAFFLGRNVLSGFTGIFL